MALCLISLSGFNPHAVVVTRDITFIYAASLWRGLCELRTTPLRPAGCRSILETRGYQPPHCKRIAVDIILMIDLSALQISQHFLIHIISGNKQSLLRLDGSDRCDLGRIDVIPIGWMSFRSDRCHSGRIDIVPVK